MKTKLLCILCIVFALNIQAQTYVPDDAFEQKLIDLGYDSGPLDDYVPTANINTVTNLFINGNPISDLTGIEDFTALEGLTIKYTNITSLDLSNNIALIGINCTSNAIVNINGLLNLEEILLYDNNISAIDLSTNSALIKFNGGQNPYTSLDFSNNPNIEWIGSPFGNLTGVNLTGITTLEEVYIQDNQITSLDLSGNPNLFWLDAQDNSLTNINLTGATALQYCNVYNNQLPTLDVSTNTNLLNLSCYNNQLTTLDVSTNVVLDGLLVSDNLLTSINLVGANMLTNLNCRNNQLTTLDVNNNTNLNTLIANNNILTNVAFSNAIGLTNINLNDNQLTSLDFSIIPNITYLYLSNNALTTLDIKNGNNVLMAYSSRFAASNNPNLICIEVDDATWSTSTWTNIDSSTSFSEDCSTMSIEDNELYQISIYPNPVSEYITIKGIEITSFNYQIIDILGKVVKSESLISKKLDVSNLKEGFYFLKIFNNHEMFETIKFIKQQYHKI